MKYLVTVYLAKECLLWRLLKKKKKYVSLNEISKTQGIYKKTVP